MSEWKPDRSGKYLTVVYRDLIPGDEVGEVIDHPKAVIMSWSNAVDDVQQLSNTTPPQRTTAVGEDTRRAWVDLTEEEIYAAMRKTRFPSTDITVSQSVIEAFKGKNT